MLYARIMILNRNLAAFAAVNGALAVLGGAFAAHGAGPAVKTLLQTGAQYQMVHAVLALVCAIWPSRPRMIDLAGWLAASGGLAFAAALASIGLLGLKVMGAVAPIGGLLMIAGWTVIAFAAFRSRSVND